MAIISAYPVGTPAAGDYLVGSNITTAGTQINPTKNFVLSDVVATGIGYTSIVLRLIDNSGGPGNPATVTTIFNPTTITFTSSKDVAVGGYTLRTTAGLFPGTDQEVVNFSAWSKLSTLSFAQANNGGPLGTININVVNIAGVAVDGALDTTLELRLYT